MFIQKSIVEKHLTLLGLPVKDKVTDYEGIVNSVCFDLFGCIQADVRPKKLGKDGQMQTGVWIDINRLIVLDTTPLMKRPNYHYSPLAEGEQGAADKPVRM